MNRRARAARRADAGAAAPVAAGRAAGGRSGAGGHRRPRPATPGPHRLGAEPFDMTATAAAGEVLTATVDPATRARTTSTSTSTAPSGTEPLPVDAVQVTAGTAGVPPRRLQVTPVSTNHVTVAGASLPSRRHVDRRGDGRAGGPTPGLHVRGADRMTTVVRPRPSWLRPPCVGLLAVAWCSASARPPAPTTATPSSSIESTHPAGPADPLHRARDVGERRPSGRPTPP